MNNFNAGLEVHMYSMCTIEMPWMYNFYIQISWEIATLKIG